MVALFKKLTQVHRDKSLSGPILDLGLGKDPKGFYVIIGKHQTA